MRRLFILAIMLILGLVVIIPVQAQSATTALDSMAVDIWPDYDQPSVLVLLTGTLPNSTAFPATVTIPVPENANVNAVARIDDATGNMLTDVEADDSIPGQISLTTPSARFRIEYYVPYEVAGSQHSYTFSWLADVSVTDFQVSIQKPVAAAGMTTVPDEATEVTGSDGLRYLNFPIQPVPAGQTYAVEFSYNMPVNQLTVDLLEPAQLPPAIAPAPASETGGSGLTLDSPVVIAGMVIAGVMVIVGVIIWLVASRRAAPARTRKPRPVRRATTPGTTTVRPPAAPQGSASGQVKFCHECGQPTEAGDRFCRNCGTALKQR